MLGDERTVLPAEGLEPEWRRLLEYDLDRVVVESLDPVDIAIGSDGDRRSRGVGRVLPVEDDVVRGERPSIVPGHALLEVPDDPFAVAAKPAVVRTRDVGGQHGR